MKQYIVDAFTDKIFSGNPAAVCALESFPSEEIMQSIAAEHEMQPFWDKVLTAKQQKNIGHFYLRGGFDFSKLTSGDKILMKMLKVRLQKLKKRTEDEQGMLDAYVTPVDFRNKENIRPLLDYVLK